MAGTTARQKSLYGSQREARKRNLQLVKTLKASTVLGDGDYNYTPNDLSQGVWQTSNKRDFPGVGLDRSHTIGAVTQLTEHFRLGNDSGNNVPQSTYKLSTTKDNYDSKPISKIEINAEDKTVNWPDMAPQYRFDNGQGESEYANNFVQQNRSTSAPVYPKVNTAIMELPLDPTRFHVQRGSNYYFGTDDKSDLSEHQRAFGRCNASEDFTEMLASSKSDVGVKMKTLERQSNVFRSGDYNSSGGCYESTTVNDFGPRTLPRAQVSAQSNRLKTAKSVASEPDMRSRRDVPNMLTQYARDVTVPAVFSDAAEGRNYQTEAHFQFGTWGDGINSVYGKDYKMSALASRAVPRMAITRDAGNVLQSDPEFSNPARSLKSFDFMAPPRPLVKITDNNAGGKYLDHINISFDPSSHTEDRQKSVAHRDYNKHPVNYRSLPGFVAKAAPYSYLETDNALPYEGLPRGSENKHQFIGSFMQGFQAMDRRRQKEEACKNRASNTKGTHFIVGDAPGNFCSESSYSFLGKPKSDRHIAPAGKTEIPATSEFAHLGHSQNTQTLRHNDAHVTNAQEGIRARHLYQPTQGGNPFDVSVMKEDFGDLHTRSLTDAQLRVLRQNDKLEAKRWEDSHLFHADNSGTNQYRSVTMHDFIQPETMTGGRKFLAAR